MWFDDLDRRPTDHDLLPCECGQTGVWWDTANRIGGGTQYTPEWIGVVQLRCYHCGAKHRGFRTSMDIIQGDEPFPVRVLETRHLIRLKLVRPDWRYRRYLEGDYA